ncbi:MAG: MFS transporter [Chlamydiia bacterium]|nr:MFS transporter [Chlamydiia bacterium]
MKQENKAYFSASLGNVLEFYDFALYGFFASVLSEEFFPLKTPLNSLLLTFGVFAVGFLARPLGAMIFGLIGDKYGRRTCLSGSLIGIAFATTAIGLLPTYATWGVAAPICLTFLRILQGICLGGEYSNSLIFVSEYLERFRNKYPAFSLGCVSAMGVVGWFMASLLGIYFKNNGDFLFSWRIPFLLGSIVGVIGYYIRKHIEDAYESDAKSIPFFEGLKELWRYPKQCFQVMSVGILMGSLFYGQFIFSYSFLPLVTDLSAALVNKAVSIALFSYILFLPFVGWIADRLGHKRLLIFSCVASFFLSPFLFYLSTSGQFYQVVISQTVVAFILSALMSPGTYYMSLAFPPQIRCSAASVSYNIGATLFGGMAPSVGIMLYKLFQTPIACAIFLSTSALIAGIGFSTIQVSKRYQEQEGF